MRIPFIVGRATARATELKVVARRGDEVEGGRPSVPCPIPGPWVLEGVVDVRSSDEWRRDGPTP